MLRGARQDKRPPVYVAPIVGVIDLGLAPFVQRVLDEAAEASAAAAKGKLLKLTTEEALKHKAADFRADTMASLLEHRR